MKIRDLRVRSGQRVAYPLLFSRDAGPIYIQTKNKLFRIEENENGDLGISTEEPLHVYPRYNNHINLTTSPFDIFKRATLEDSDV